MKLYLAARPDRRVELQALARSIEQLGHVVTSRWLAGLGREDADNARYDLADVVVADALVLFAEESNSTAPFRGRRDVEFGYALRAGKNLFIVGPRENIFHHLPDVRRFSDADELLDFLAHEAEPIEPATSGRRGLTRDERARLFAHVELHLRTLALYTMASRFGLGAPRLSRLNLSEVTPDGKTIHAVLRIGSATQLECSVEPQLANVLKRFLGYRCTCAHWRLSIKTYRDGDIERCHLCHEDVRPRGNPLFISKQRRRLSPNQMRHEFRQHRDALGLHPGLTFESLLMPAEAAPI
jgi:hypothetical protein